MSLNSITTSPQTYQEPNLTIYFMSILIFLQTCCQPAARLLLALTTYLAVADRLADVCEAAVIYLGKNKQEELDFLAVDRDNPVNSELIRTSYLQNKSYPNVKLGLLTWFSWTMILSYTGEGTEGS